MKTDTIVVGNLQVGDHFTDITPGSNTFGAEYVVSYTGSYVAAYMVGDVDADDPAEFELDEVVQITIN